jgi:hypothetical protein
MFYLKKNTDNPHEAIAAKINAFLGKDVLLFRRY